MHWSSTVIKNIGLNGSHETVVLSKAGVGGGELILTIHAKLTFDWKASLVQNLLLCRDCLTRSPS